MARRLLVAGNWKLHGSRAMVKELASAVASGAKSLDVDVLVCPTAVHIADVADAIQSSGLLLGAQNCASETGGAFTGEIAPAMLAEFGCDYVIVGHSERRALFDETSEWVAAKCVCVQQVGLTPILCVGETLEQRETGQIDAVIGAQLDALLDIAGVEAFASIVVAYEPVWAIGTGKTASPEQAQAVHAMVRDKIAGLDAQVAEQLRILYGGSVKPDNAATLFAQPDIDGGLIGGASLDAPSFLAICEAADQI